MGGGGWRIPLTSCCEEELAASKGPEDVVLPASETERSRLCIGGLASSWPGLTERLMAEWGTNAAGDVKE
jgi:hypothetical protein